MSSVLTCCQLNAAVAAGLLNHNVVWLPGPTGTETPHLYYRPDNLRNLRGNWLSLVTLPVPNYCRDWTSCQSVVEAMTARGYTFSLQRQPDSHYLVGFERNGSGLVLFAQHEIATTAICLGALRAIGILEPDPVTEALRLARPRKAS